MSDDGFFPANWPDLGSVPAFSLGRNEAEGASLESLKRKAQKSYRVFKGTDNIAEIGEEMKSFEKSWSSYMDSGLISLLKAVQAPDEKKCMDDLDRFVLEIPELEMLVSTISEPILGKEKPEAIAEFLGPAFMMRLSKRAYVRSGELVMLLQQETSLKAKGPSNPGPEEILRRSQLRLAFSGKETDEARKAAFEALIKTRKNIAVKAGLSSPAQYAALKYEDYSEIISELSNFTGMLRKYFLPQALKLRAELSETLGLDTKSFCLRTSASLPTAPLMPKFSHFADELSFIQRFILKLFSSKIPTFITALHEKNYLNFHFAGSFVPWADAFILRERDLPVLVGGLEIIPENLAPVLSSLGLCISYLLNRQNGSFALIKEAAEPMKSLIEISLPMLSIEKLPELFEYEDEGRLFRRIWLASDIFRICDYGLMFDFENYIYSAQELESAEIKKIWAEKFSVYYPDISEPENYAEAYLKIPLLWKDAYLSFVKLYASFFGLQLWQSSLENFDSAASGLIKILGCLDSDTTERILERQGYGQPLSEACLKKSAYRLALNLEL